QPIGLDCRTVAESLSTGRRRGTVRPVDSTLRPVGSPGCMRRFALTCLCLALAGCGYDTWWNPPFTSGSNPHMPVGDSENMRHVMGEQAEAPHLPPEPGNIWPGPLPPAPTLQDLEQQGQPTGPERPVPGSPEFQGQQPSLPPPPPARGSST